MIQKKIDDLFEYRRIPYMLSISQIDTKSVINELKQIQHSIYELDALLESTWIIQNEDLSLKWDQIYQSLKPFGFLPSTIEQLTKQIRRYQKHELDIRKGLNPMRLSAKYLYYYKSCDVRLMRRIIYHLDPRLKKMIKPTAWNLFDYITEVNDDLEDLREDKHTFNANRFLFSIAQNGWKKTGEDFSGIVDQVTHGIEGLRKQVSKYPLIHNVVHLTSDAVEHTQLLFQKQQRRITPKEMRTSKVYQHFINRKTRRKLTKDRVKI